MNTKNKPTKNKPTENKPTKKRCHHSNKTKKRLMDFSFYICNDCGYQWKA